MASSYRQHEIGKEHLSVSHSKPKIAVSGRYQRKQINSTMAYSSVESLRSPTKSPSNTGSSQADTNMYTGNEQMTQSASKQMLGLPSLHTPLSPRQKFSLVQRVNYDNTMLQMATNDDNLIQQLKDTIQFQANTLKQREKLLHAITHNIAYLNKIHSNNSEEHQNTKERLEWVEKQNAKLQEENDNLNLSNGNLMKDRDELNQKRKDIQKLVVESQANAREIERLHEQNEQQGDNMEKLNLEVQVVVTEKMAMKKELDRVDALYNKIKREFKEQRVSYNLMVDENSKLIKQNSEYRGLILDNESKLEEISQQIVDMQQHLELKNKQIQRSKEEVSVYQKQQEKLLDELREKSDSESFDDEKQRILNVKKAMETDQFKENVKNLKQEIKIKADEAAANIKRIENNLKFSTQANKNLKSDYDLLQEKMDKNMKVSNNLVQDLKEELEELNNRCSRLQIFYDDNTEIMQGERDKAKKEMNDLTTRKDEEIKDIREQRDKMQKELDDFKKEFQMKMTQVKLMEMELEEKLQAAQGDDD